MNDEYDYEEEQSSLDSIGEVVRKRKNLTNNVHRNYNPKIGKAGLSQTNPKNTINNSNKKNVVEDTNKNTSDDLDFSSIEDENASKTVSGIYNASKFFTKNKWLLIIICGGSFFFFILLIASVFLLQNADTLNYVSGNFYANEKYQRLYVEINNVSTEYKRKYGVTIDTHLIISVLTSYRDNSIYADDTESGLYEVLEEYDNRSKMGAMIETLAKYQVKTITNCDKDSSTMRKIASNDDSLNITNFWTSELSREKNYQCDSSASGTTYVLSIEQGNLDDENSGSVFFWNLIDEGFFKEYYPEYFANLSGEDYEKKAAETLDYMYLYYESIKKYDTTTITTTERNIAWWPIGSSEQTEVEGKILANGEPVEYTILSGYSNSGGLEIGATGDVNIIAVKSGTVIYPNDHTQISYPNSEEADIENELGNYILIEHSDGTYTLYAHLAPDTISVVAGDQVTQGEVIGKMGSSGAATEQKLRFEVRVGGSETKNRVNPENYVDSNIPRYQGGEFSLTSTSLTKTEFVALMNWYCISSSHSAFCTNFANHAEEVYEVSLANNVNPELVVVTAGTEQNWKKCAGLYNFWGIGIPNGKTCSDGPQLTSLEEGIKSYARNINSYLEGGSRAEFITSRYNERSKAGCDPAGHGPPGTLAGMQSIYSWIGNYRYDPGDWGLGGCVYLDIIYGDGYCKKLPTCKDKNSCPANSKTTICEQNDYTAWQLQGKVKLRQKIFGL